MQLESTSLCMQCNIDAKGKAVRLKLGILGILGGIAVAISFFVIQPNWEMMWIIPAGMIFGGAFSVFEGWAGWCVVRAMGFKTPH